MKIKAHTLLSISIVILLIVSIPWYRTPAEESELTILGFPDWVVIALACYFLAALLNVYLWFISSAGDDKP